MVTVKASTLLVALLWLPSVDAAERSLAVRAEFQRMNPCPSTGKPRGRCPGYQVDHREALMHREKTRVEVKLCRPRASAAQL